MSRLDKILAEKYGFSRNKAQQFIEAGLVLVNGQKTLKIGQKIIESSIISILEDRRIHWVSRSAEKLFWFLEKPSFAHIKNKILDSTCLDVGSSTGGFTQVLLEFWAKHIDAVDVWSGQLHENLKNNAKIFSHENTDIREFESKMQYDFIVCDASFISLQKIVPAILNLANSSTEIILLFKPQFEVGKENINKHGVPKNESIIISTLKTFENYLQEKNCKILAIEKSSLVGEAWNQEYIFYIQKNLPN